MRPDAPLPIPAKDRTRDGDLADGFVRLRALGRAESVEASARATAPPDESSAPAAGAAPAVGDASAPSVERSSAFAHELERPATLAYGDEALPARASPGEGASTVSCGGERGTVPTTEGVLALAPAPEEAPDPSVFPEPDPGGDPPAAPLGVADLRTDPAEPGLAVEAEAPTLWLAHRVLPWRRFGEGVAWATDRPETRARAAEALGLDPRATLFVAVATPDLDDALADRFGERLAPLASPGLDARLSVRALGPARRRVACVAVAGLSLAVLVPEAAAVALLALLFALNAATGTMRALALVHGWRRAAPPPDAEPRAGPSVETPDVSLLVPLFREARMVGEIVGAIDRLDYPRDRLEVKLVVEAADAATRRAVEGASLPPWVSVVVVPDGGPRTKPRALNYALNLCRGAVVGILDAEDRPEPGQLRAVADAFAGLAPDYGCVQCRLRFHNARESWISRCFQLEYAIWFDVLLRGWERLGLPIPLGGTSVYFRRDALEAVGGWDAHNVTEDADLGMRLYCRGWRTRLLDEATDEEANCRWWPWVRQRSRWLKGDLLTWLCHARDPRALWRDLGPRGFLAFNVLFLGAAASYLAMPLFWGSLAASLAAGESVWGRWLPGWALWPVYASLAVGQGVMLAAAARAAARARALDLLAWAPALPLYWTLGAMAAWKAVAELFVAPYYWDKTRHGTSRALARSAGRGEAP
ncbi:MAG: glycosyltransferase [Paracoccaceae bacterium]